MARPPKERLRELTDGERRTLEHLAQSRSERAGVVFRAKEILSVAAGQSFTAAARAAGGKSNDALARLVRRFNGDGLSVVYGHHGGGTAIHYGHAEAERILREFHRAPDRESDGTAAWSLTTLQRAVRKAPDGLPTVSTWTILRVLHAAGYTWQESRTWCDTGVAKRKRKAGVVEVKDPRAEEKRGPSKRRTC